MSDENKPIVVGPGDTTISPDDYRGLMQFLHEHFKNANPARDNMVRRCEEVDKALFLARRLTDAERAIHESNSNGKPRRSVRPDFPSADAHLDAIVTDLLALLAPSGNLYQATADAEKQVIANAFVSRMREDAKIFKHYPEVRRAIYSGLAYDLGGWRVRWRETSLRQPIQNTEDEPSANPVASGRVLFRDTSYAANELKAIDPYNTWMDSAIRREAFNIGTDGEFFATGELMDSSRFVREVESGVFFNAEGLREGTDPKIASPYTFPGYVERPQLDEYLEAAENVTKRQQLSDLFNYFRKGAEKRMVEPGQEVELLDIYVRIIPKDFGLRVGGADTADEPEIWNIVIANRQVIVYASKFQAQHDLLPVTLYTPANTLFGTDSRSVGQKLIPVQDWIIERLLIKNKADRKALIGVTYFDQHRIPALNQFDPDNVSLRVPVNTQNRSNVPTQIGHYLHQSYDVPQTQQLQNDIALGFELLNRVFPVSNVSNVTGMDRATRFQAAQAAYTMSRRTLDAAVMCDIMLLQPSRHMIYYNYLEFMDTLEVRDPDTKGEMVSVTPAQLLEANVQFTLGSGLKGFDQLSIIQLYQDVMGLLIQSSQAQNVDFLKMVGHIAQTAGDQTDFNQFVNKTPIMSLPQEQQDMAYQLLVQHAQQQAEAQNPQNPQPAQPNPTQG